MTADVKTALVHEARSIGFTDARITRPDAIPHAPEALREFVDAGAHGQMAWMADRMNWRGDPAALWPEARSIIMLAYPYDGAGALAGLDIPTQGNISVYARGRDYHDVVKKKLKHLGRWLIGKAGGEIKVFVDTAPVMEKPLAQAAGIGWQGKHTNLVGRRAGNWFFLGAIFTTLDLVEDAGEVDHCGSCRQCLDACPTNAFPAPYRMDARRCISYLTIEYKGAIPEEFRLPMGNRIYGCDDCLAACPWNKFAQAAHDVKLAQRDDLKKPALADLLALDDAGFRTLFSGSPIKRIGWARFMRNCLYAAGNSGETQLQARVAHFVDHEDAVLRDAAVWAQERLEAI